MTNSEYGVLRQDQIVADLVRLHGIAPHEIAQAGGRIMERIRERTERELSEKRTSILAELEIIERARNIVLGSEEPPAVSDAEQLFSSGVRTLEVPVEPDVPALCQAKQLHDTVSALREFEEKHGDLDRTPAIDAYLIDYAERYRDGEERHGHEPTPEAEIIEERRRELDPENVTHALHTLPFQLVLELLGMMRQDVDRVRPAAEWWEVVVLVLTLEYPDLGPADLGLEGDLPWGGWEKIGSGNTFAHRDGMRAYMGLASGNQDKAVTDETFWTLAQRATIRLRAHEVAPSAAHAEAATVALQSASVAVSIEATSVASESAPAATGGDLPIPDTAQEGAEVAAATEDEDSRPKARRRQRRHDKDARASAAGVAAANPGISFRELERITGIPSSTLARWSLVQEARRRAIEVEAREPTRGFRERDEDGGHSIEAIQDADVQWDSDWDNRLDV